MRTEKAAHTYDSTTGRRAAWASLAASVVCLSMFCMVSQMVATEGFAIVSSIACVLSLVPLVLAVVAWRFRASNRWLAPVSLVVATFYAVVMTVVEIVALLNLPVGE